MAPRRSKKSLNEFNEKKFYDMKSNDQSAPKVRPQLHLKRSRQRRLCAMAKNVSMKIQFSNCMITTAGTTTVSLF